MVLTSVLSGVSHTIVNSISNVWESGTFLIRKICISSTAVAIEVSGNNTTCVASIFPPNNSPVFKLMKVDIGSCGNGIRFRFRSDARTVKTADISRFEGR
ncbi:hypothetical protein NPIL_499231 [Nephila pilipes]|uniref:Uncharacterized protein n=1 Tax=Nephila pilipes TaxID=299642 RepID=A0A8X6T7J5_NEPPI|nr:hypothetical protein NPIL_499231 [Nephila pilipes]